jgi:hypothetical protein
MVVERIRGSAMASVRGVEGPWGPWDVEVREEVRPEEAEVEEEVVEEEVVLWCGISEWPYVPGRSS